MNQETEYISEQLLTYLRERLNQATIDYADPLTQLQGGFETHIYRFQLNNASGKLANPLILRLYPEFYGTSNAIWESTIQQILIAEDYPVAEVHLVCTDMSVLGGAFFIMDFLPGKPLVAQPMETIPQLLGNSHAALHRIDPARLIRAFKEQGIDENALRLSSRYQWLAEKADKFSWLAEAIDWLIRNQPPEPDQLAACHGDFHPLNILVQDGVVTGVLDWPGFVIADPALDIAQTIVLTTIPFKHIAPTLGLDVSTVDFNAFTDQYLQAYRAEKDFNDAPLSHYRVRRCVYALLQGAEGQVIWQHPLIIQDLLDYIQTVTSLKITLPA